jgi:hypothetical protein
MLVTMLKLLLLGSIKKKFYFLDPYVSFFFVVPTARGLVCSSRSYRVAFLVFID